MSVQFGRWNYDGRPTSQEYVEKVSATLAPYGPDSNESYTKGTVKILYRAFCTTKESWREKQPHVSPSGNVITWDGRLDNRTELIRELYDSVSAESTDIAIVAAAYEKWGHKSFAKLIGDWALSVWNSANRTLLLAKDVFGSRHLYYSSERDHAVWCTILDPLVLFAGRTFSICEEYIAGWFSQVPAAHLTPYLGISSVPPASYVVITPGTQTVHKYWNFDPRKRIRYRSDAEYEEHFREVFAKAVQRKLRSDRPVLADLSGGMDSGSIVCMADVVMARGLADCPRVDTISWYNDSYDHLEPDFNELHWVAKVEEKRGRAGYHISLACLNNNSHTSSEAQFECDHFAATPYPPRDKDAFFKQYASLVKQEGHRVTLSGIGGEIPTGGGFPTPTPELQNLLSRAHFLTLARQVKAWATKMRTARLPLLRDAVRGFFRQSLAGTAEPIDSSSPWFEAGFVRRNRTALWHYPTRTKFFGPLPSIQNLMNGLEYERRLLATFGTGEVPALLRDVRYPFMDRDLREFVCAIPWEQIVRVGQRRSLLRRALTGIVPDEILKRKPKGFVPPEMKEKAAPPEEPGMFATADQTLVSSSIGIINAKRFFEALQRARRNEEGVSRSSLTPTLTLEAWLRHLITHGVLASPLSAKKKSIAVPLEVEAGHVVQRV